MPPTNPPFTLSGAGLNDRWSQTSDNWALFTHNIFAITPRLKLTVGIDNPRVKQIPVPKGVRAVIIHPHMFLSTKSARAILRRTVEMSDPHPDKSRRLEVDHVHRDRRVTAFLPIRIVCNATTFLASIIGANLPVP